MADQALNTSANEPVFNIQRIYLKDASMEQPNSPQIFLEQGNPEVDINLGIEQAQLGEGVFEVALTGTVTAKIGDKTLFLVECKQAGIFEVSGFAADQIGPILGVNCPQMLFPYLRAQISDLVVRGGFPPVVLNEVNFPAIYAAQLEQQAQGTPTPN
ncbi:MAG: protein-export chaperone SecB [Cellvibrionales bacterium]|nr:MAG: protein-export chaperone SecB [Cellvibrionales bacterium]